MRFCWIIAAFAMLSGSPAAADITARYVNPTSGAPGLTVEVNDAGDSRTSVSNRMAILTRGGVTYILTSDLSGPFAIKQEDYLAALLEKMRRARYPRPSAHSNLPPFEIVAGGTETVGGRNGKLWMVRRKGARVEPDSPSSPGFDFVISTDPDLAPIGRALATQFGVTMAGAVGLLATPDFAASVNGVFAKGTVIRMSRAMRLESIDRNVVPASRFALTGPVLTRKQYLARSAVRPQR